MKTRLLMGLLAVAVIAFGLAGPLNAKGLFDNIKGALKGGGQEQDKTQLDAFKSAIGLDEPCGGDGAATLSNARVEQGLGTVEEAQLGAYLNAIAGKLLAASPRPHCRISVYVTPHDSTEAVSLADGGILITLGFLRNLKNEDEVAALLAHELSHILLNHHASDSFVDTQDQFLKGMDTANMAGSMFLGAVDPNLAAGLDTASAVGSAVHGVSEGLIAPAWTREQEDEADLLGTDLAAAAGYNPRGMAAIMEVIKAHEAGSAEVDAERDKLRQQRLQGVALQTATGTNPQSTISIIGSVAKIVGAAAESASQNKKEHRSAEEREKRINEYIRKHHGEARRRSFAAEPWQASLSKGSSGVMFEHFRAASEARRLVYTGGDLAQAQSLAQSSLAGDFADDPYPRLAYAEVRLKQGDQNEAAEVLRAALQQPDAPWQLHRSLADLQLKAGDIKGAVATVASADRAFGEPLGIAPYAIKVYKAAGDQKMVNVYLDRCNSAGKRQHLEVCLAAAGQTKEQYQRGKLTRGG